MKKLSIGRIFLFSVILAGLGIGLYLANQKFGFVDFRKGASYSEVTLKEWTFDTTTENWAYNNISKGNFFVKDGMLNINVTSSNSKVYPYISNNKLYLNVTNPIYVLLARVRMVVASKSGQKLLASNNVPQPIPSTAPKPTPGAKFSYNVILTLADVKNPKNLVTMKGVIQGLLDGKLQDYDVTFKVSDQPVNDSGKYSISSIKIDFVNSKSGDNIKIDSIKLIQQVLNKPTPRPTSTPVLICTNKSQGGPTSCKSAETWKLYASQNCQAINNSLGTYKLRESCSPTSSDYYRYIDYTCCVRGGIQTSKPVPTYTPRPTYIPRPTSDIVVPTPKAVPSGAVIVF